MLQIGQINSLEIVKETDQGIYLDGGSEAGEILLPRRYVPKFFNIGEKFDVFVHYDSQDRLVATTDTPFAKLGEFALLEVRSVEDVGAFLDWGLSKDLFLPFREQTREVKVGHKILVYLYLDKSNRIAATMRLEKNLVKVTKDFQAGATVQLVIYSKTDMGFKAIVDGKYAGLLYANEVFQPIAYAQKLTGYIAKAREDGKLDLILQPLGYGAAQGIERKILELLQASAGFLAIDDKTTPEQIYEMFGVSKKKYKMALGGLYKKRVITIKDDGIYLN